MGVSRKNRRGAKSSKAATPHDALFHYTFSDIEHARPTLQALLPARIGELVDFAQLQLAPGHFVDTSLAQSRTDLLYSAPIAGRPGRIYVLFEHQSVPEQFMMLRLLRYLVRIWEQFIEANPSATKLPVIIPLVLHHSETGWTTPRRYEHLLDIDENELRDVAEFVPRFGMVLHDISRASDDDLMGLAVTALAKISLLLFRFARSVDEPKQLFMLLDKHVAALQDVIHSPSGAEAVAVVIRYIHSVTKQSIDEVTMTMRETMYIDMEEYNAIRYAADRLREEGHKRGLREGIKEGRKVGLDEGRKVGLDEGRRSMLLEQLAERFGDVPASVTERIRAASTDDLKVMIRRILHAASLDEVLAPAPPSPAPRKRKTRT